jgi:hypothetical protein
METTHAPPEAALVHMMERVEREGLRLYVAVLWEGDLPNSVWGPFEFLKLELGPPGRCSCVSVLSNKRSPLEARVNGVTGELSVLTNRTLVAKVDWRRKDGIRLDAYAGVRQVVLQVKPRAKRAEPGAAPAAEELYELESVWSEAAMTSLMSKPPP